MADLRELIKKWRIAAMNAGKARAKAFTRCADELERALAAQPAPASVGAEAEAMKMLFLDAAEAALNRHVVQGWTDSDGGPYPLIDFLTPEGRPVSEGMGEVRLMVHSILVEIDRRLDGTGSGIRIVESNAITDGDALIVQDGRPVAKITGLAGTGGE